MPTGDAYSSGHLVMSLLGLTFVLLVETSDILYRLDIIPVCDIITGLNSIILNLTFHQILVSIEHLQRVWHAKRGRLLLRTPGPVPLGLVYVLLVETNPFPNLSLFYRTMLFEYPSVLSRFCLGRSVGVTIATQLVLLNRFTGSKPSH